MKILITILLFISIYSCGNNPENNSMQDEKIFEIVDKYSPVWIEIPGVVGVYVGTLDDNKTLCIKVMAEEITPEIKKEIPNEVENYKVIIEETGKVEPL